MIATFTATAIYHGLEDMYTETVNSLHMLNPITYLGYVKRGDIDIVIDRTKKDKGERAEYELDKFEQIDGQQKDIQLRLLRLEILNLLHNDPTNLDTILETFDEYKELGGNHYIDAIIAKWKKEQGID